MGTKGRKVREPKQSFQIKPRTRGDGFTLSSKLLLYPLWYATLNGAISYARFRGRNQASLIEIFDSEGKLLESKLIQAGEPQPVFEGINPAVEEA